MKIFCMPTLRRNENRKNFTETKRFNLDDNLTKYALLRVLETEKLSQYKEIQQLLEEINSKFCKDNTSEQAGVILKKSKDNIPVFIHQSFAEYFTAKFFLRNISKYYKFVFENILCEPTTYQNIRLFLNCMMEQDEFNSFEIKPNDNILKKIFDISVKEGNFQIMCSFLKIYKKDNSKCDILNISVDGDKYTLHHAVEHSTECVVRLLIECGAKIEVFDKYGNTPCHFAIKINSINLLNILNPKNKNIDNNNGNSLLHWAAKFDKVDVIEHLLKNKDNNINCQTKKKKSVLYWAVRYNSLNVVEKLLSYSNLELRYIAKESESVLHLAVRCKRNEMVKHLLDKDKSLQYIKNGDGYTPYDIAKIINDPQILLSFDNNAQQMEDIGRIEKGDNLIWAVKYHDAELTKSLINGGKDVNEKDQKERTALYWAVHYNAVEMVKELLKSKDININITDRYDETPLHVAVNHRHKQIIKLLLEHKPELAIKNENGDTAYDLAKLMNDKDILKLFRNFFSKSQTNKKRRHSDS